jgi:hypothetical protein
VAATAGAGAAVAGAAGAAVVMGAAVPQALRARLAAIRITIKLDTNLDFILFSSILNIFGYGLHGTDIFCLNLSIYKVEPPPLAGMDFLDPNDYLFSDNR